MKAFAQLRVGVLVSALVTAGALVAGCSTRNAEPPYLQISRQAVTDLSCDDHIDVLEINDLFTGYDPEFCAYGCGQTKRYLCSDSSGDCYGTWPDVCP